MKNPFNIRFFRKTPAVFGLDVGSRVVKAVQIDDGPDGKRLAALGLIDLPPDTIAEGAIKDPPSVVEAIKECVGTAGITMRDAVISICGRELIIKKVQIPEVPPKEVHGAVQLEAEHHIPFAIEEVFLDYQVVGARDGNLDLILVAVKKSKVNEYAGVVEEAGLNPIIVDVDGFALGNQYEVYASEADDADAVALIDIGASIMKTNVVRAGTSIFARDIPFGGNHYTQAIADHLGVPFEQAEAVKLGRNPEVAWDAISGAVDDVTRDFSLEVQRTFDYFASTAESERIGKIVLAGGCALLPGLADFLSSSWGIPVELARPFEGITVDPTFAERAAAAGPALAVAAGLALRRPGDKESS